MQTKLGVQNKDYNPKERVNNVMETVIFTTILQSDFRKLPLSELVEGYLLIARQECLLVIPTNHGLVCRKDHFEIASDMLEKSILYN